MIAASAPRFSSTNPESTSRSFARLSSRLAAVLDAIRPSWTRKRYDVGTPITWRCDCD